MVNDLFTLSRPRVPKNYDADTVKRKKVVIISIPYITLKNIIIKYQVKYDTIYRG